MDIHKPKPVHNWHELLSEIGVIIVGVLIALGAEQTVEWLHWQGEVKETRESLHAELGANLGVYKFRYDQLACINRRIDELERWGQGWKSGRPVTPLLPVSRPRRQDLEFDAWEVAQSGGVAVRIPLTERIRVAAIYGKIRTFGVYQDDDVAVWRELQDFDGASRLDRRDLMRLHGLLNRTRTLNAAFEMNYLIAAKAADALGIKAIPVKEFNLDKKAQFCGQFLPSASP
ncbi:MAG: hypothetical protein WCO83_09325 [Alphaproteobacteria bacterium]